MSKGLMWIVAACLLSGVSQAEDLEISETIQGKIAASEAQAGVNFQTRCEEWEKAVKAEAGESALYASCGAENLVTFQTITVSEKCGDYVYPGGNVVYTCFPEHSNNPPYGYAAKADAKILLTFADAHGTIESKLGGDKTACAKAGSCFKARDLALASFEQKCVDYKANAKKSFGARFLYASCGALKNTADSDTNSEFQYQATGKIFYKK